MVEEVKKGSESMRRCAFLLVSICVISNSALDSVRGSSRTEKSRMNTGEMAFGQQERPNPRSFTRGQYESTLSRLDDLVRKNDLLGVLKLGDELEGRWGRTGGEQYGLAMLEVANLLANNFANFQNSEKYCFQALAHSQTFSLRLETQFLGFLERDLAATAWAWSKERSAKAKVWLTAWGRLERLINRNFDFSKRPLLNIAPPPETGLPAGVAVSAIKDRRLRAQYEIALAANEKKAEEYNRQMRLKTIDRSLPKNAEAYLVRVYSRTPYNSQELSRYLIMYGFDSQIRERILNQVEKNISDARK